MWHDAEGRLDKAVASYDEGDLRTARTMLRGLDRRGVISPTIDLYLGHCHLGEDEIPAAIRRYRRCVALSPEDPAPWLGLGLCYGRLGRVHRALRAFENALARNENIEDAHCGLTHCYALLGDMDQAIKHARHAIRLDPRCPHVHRHMALAYLIRGEPAQSLRAWRRVRALDPHYAELASGIGRALLDLGRYREARRAFREGIEGPMAADAHFGLGDVARVRGDWNVAVSHYERAARLESGFHEARYRWAESLLTLGAPIDARRVLMPNWEVEADGTRALPPGFALLRARIEAACGDQSKGLGLLRGELRAMANAVLDDDKGSAWIDRMNDLGEYLLDRDRLHVAKGILRRAGRRDGGTARTWRLLARVHARLGDGKRARSTLARTAFRWPENTELVLDVAAAHIAAGRDVSAERALLYGLERFPVSADLWAAAAELALERDDLDSAHIRVSVALRCQARHPLALGILTRIHLLRDHARRALHAGRAAMRVVPPGDPAIPAYVEALLAVDRWPDALLRIRKYVLDAPDDAAGYLLLARCQERAGDPAAASTQRRLARLVDLQRGPSSIGRGVNGWAPETSDV